MSAFATAAISADATDVTGAHYGSPWYPMVPPRLLHRTFDTGGALWYHFTVYPTPPPPLLIFVPLGAFSAYPWQAAQCRQACLTTRKRTCVSGQHFTGQWQAMGSKITDDHELLAHRAGVDCVAEGADRSRRPVAAQSPGDAPGLFPWCPHLCRKDGED
jgi:hypothetical protein